MSKNRLKRDIDWEINGNPSPAIALSRAWDETVSNFNNPATSDTNRLGIIIVHNEEGSLGSQVSSIIVNGQSATELESSFSRPGGLFGFSNEYTCYYLTETQLALIGTNPAITVNFNFTPDVFSIATAIYSNVNQSTPAAGTNNFDDTQLSGITTITASAEDEGVSILGSGGGQPVTSVTVTGYTQVADISNFGGDAFVFQKLPSAAPSETANITITGEFNRYVSFIVNLRKA